MTTVSIWFHTRSAQSNVLGLKVLKDNSAEIETKIKGQSISWREQATSSLDVSIQGIGWGTENAQARKELLRVLAVLTEIAKKYEPEIRRAMSSGN